MKIRISGNSIRLRLNQTEVAQLIENKSIVETTSFPVHSGSAFSYKLSIDANCTSIQAKHNQGEIYILLPEKIAVQWAETDQVGMEEELALEDGKLRILIEKDFACLTERAHEDDSNAFPNPNLSC